MHTYPYVHVRQCLVITVHLARLCCLCSLSCSKVKRCGFSKSHTERATTVIKLYTKWAAFMMSLKFWQLWPPSWLRSYHHCSKLYICQQEQDVKHILSLVKLRLFWWHDRSHFAMLRLYTDKHDKELNGVMIQNQLVLPLLKCSLHITTSEMSQQSNGKLQFLTLVSSARQYNRT